MPPKKKARLPRWFANAVSKWFATRAFDISLFEQEVPVKEGDEKQMGTTTLRAVKLNDGRIVFKDVALLDAKPQGTSLA